jgi:hypothetical protein
MNIDYFIYQQNMLSDWVDRNSMYFNQEILKYKDLKILCELISKLKPFIFAMGKIILKHIWIMDKM